MKKQSASRSAFFSPRGSITLLISGAAACSILSGALLAFFRSEAPTNRSQRTLTFEQRVAYQKAIEEGYWRHRIWPTSRHDPKPTLDAVMSQAQLEKKVADYLRDSQVLEDSCHHPITAEQLQAEMDRMAQHTKQPEVLREIFAALGNDPFVIAECLARPILAERSLTELNEDRVNLTRIAWRKQPLQSWVAKAESQVPVTMAAVSANYTLPAIAGPSGGCANDTWTPTSTTNAPDVRADWSNTAVWTGSEMIVWGGYGGSSLNTGGRYNPSTDSWTATSTINAPAGRSAHTAVWTGSEMIVWGGEGDSGDRLNTGGRYSPSTDSWIATTTSNAPSAREFHTAVWTGSEMIVWGGFNSGVAFNTGGRYNPSTDSWTATSTTNAPAARYEHTAVWTGSEMIVWGGTGGLPTGGRYNPSTDSWTATSTANAPTARFWHTAVWTGSQMIVWGGYNGSAFNTGGRYNPSTDSWTVTSTTDAPAARYLHRAVLTGSEMIVWGGHALGPVDLNTGGRYNPGADNWTATSTTNAPTARDFHMAVWTGSEMIVWGGYDGTNYFNTGGKYCAVAPSSTPTPTATATATATPTPTATATPRPTPTPRSTPPPQPRPTPPPRP